MQAAALARMGQMRLSQAVGVEGLVKLARRHAADSCICGLGWCLTRHSCDTACDREDQGFERQLLVIVGVIESWIRIDVSFICSQYQSSTGAVQSGTD